MLRDWFDRQLYVQLSPTRLSVRDPRSGRSVAEVPEIAVRAAPGRKPVVVDVGAQARAHAAEPDVRVLNPFAHPRSLVSDFVAAQQVFKALFRRVSGPAWLQPAPRAVLHPLGEHEGGLTQVELRALHELALGAGASGVRIWQGAALSDEQLLSREFGAAGALLSH